MTTVASVVDAGGNPTTGTADAIARVDRTIDLLLPYHVDLIGGTTPNAHAGNGFWITVHVTSIP